MSVEDNKQVIRDFFEAMSDGDLDGALGTCQDDVEWTVIGDTPVSQTFRGLKALAEEFFGEVFQRVDVDAGVKIEILEMIGEGDRVVARGQGTITGNHGPYNNTYCYVFTLRDGKIAANVLYLDTALIHRSLYGKNIA